MFTYKTIGVCSREIHFDIVDGKLHNVSFDGGCPGNLAAIGKLVEGQDAKAVADLLKGNDCRPRHQLRRPIGQSYLRASVIYKDCCDADGALYHALQERGKEEPYYVQNFKKYRPRIGRAGAGTSGKGLLA